jgi:hypothetical protein
LFHAYRFTLVNYQIIMLLSSYSIVKIY